MAEAEGRHDMFPLKSVLVSFNDDKPVSEYSSEEITDSSRLFEIVGRLQQDVTQRAGIRQEQSILVERASQQKHSIIIRVPRPLFEV